MRSDHAHHGLNDLKARSLLETMWQGRTHRVSRVTAGDMSYDSPRPRAPFSPIRSASDRDIARSHRSRECAPDDRFSWTKQSISLRAAKWIASLARNDGGQNHTASVFPTSLIQYEVP